MKIKLIFFGIFASLSLFAGPLVYTSVFPLQPKISSEDKQAVQSFVANPQQYLPSAIKISPALNEFPQVKNASHGAGENGEEFIFIETHNVNEANALTERIFDGIQKKDYLVRGNQRSFTTTTNEKGVLLTFDTAVIAVFAPSSALLDKALSIEPLGKIHTLSRAYGEKQLQTILGFTAFVALYFIFLGFFIWTRVASWATTIEPTEIQPVLLKDIKMKLLALNNNNLPFVVKEEGEMLIVDWKYQDASYVSLLQAGNIKRLNQLRLRFDESAHTVNVQDRSANIKWKANVTEPQITLQFSMFQGITLFEYYRSKAYGLTVKDGEIVFDKLYDIQFSSSELKQPFIQLITSLGWRYRPVVYFNKLLNG